MKRWLTIGLVLLAALVLLTALVIRQAGAGALLDGWNLSWAAWRDKAKEIEWKEWLEIFGQFVAIAAGIGTLVGLIHKLRAKRDAVDQSVDKAPHVQASPEQMLSPDDSIETYLDALARILREAALREHFVVLSAQTEARPNELLPYELVQSFEYDDEKHRAPIDLLNAHKQFDRYVLLGAPGSGKTTCLKRLTLDLVEACRGDRGNEPIPVFCPLARWTDRRMTALDFIRRSVAECVGANNWVLQQLSSLLESGRLVVIFDGLNEMPHRSRFRREQKQDSRRLDRDQLADDFSSGNLLPCNIDSREQSLRELARSHGVRSRFILSCRTHEFTSSMGWPRIHVLPMDDDQIREFLSRYLDEERCAALGGVLEKKPALWELARNPFYLAMLTWIAEDDLEKVENRGQFLRKLLEALIKREKAKGREHVDAQRFMRRLSRVAFKMIDADMIGSQVDLEQIGRLDDDSKALGLNTGMLVKRDGGVTFYHQLVQEFFAAYALQQGHVWRSLGRLLRKQKWVEVATLYHDISERPERSLRRLRRLLKQRNGLTLRPYQPPRMILVFLTAIIAYGFVTSNFVIDLIAGGGFWSALAWNHPASIAVYFSLPFALYFLAPAFCFHRMAIANAAYVLARVRTSATVDEIVADLVIAFNRMGLLRKRISDALVEVGPASVPTLIAGLSSAKPAIRRGCIETLGLLKEEDAIEPLIAILRFGDHRFFPTTIRALSHYDNDRCRKEIAESLRTFLPELDGALNILRLPNLLGAFGVAFKEGLRSDEQLAIRLATFAQSKNASTISRQLAIIALGTYGHPAGLPTLKEIAHDASDPLAKMAIQQVPNIRSADVVDTLMSIIDAGDLERNVTPPAGNHLKDAAMKSLAKLTSRESVGALVNLLDDDRWWIRDAAINSLGSIGDPQCVPHVIERLDELRPLSGTEVAQALGRIGGDDAFEGLMALAVAPGEQTRVQALTYLDLRYPDRAGPALMRLLLDPGYPERMLVLELLADAPPPGNEFRQILLKLQRDPDRKISKRALRLYHHLNRSLDERLKRIGVVLSGGIAGVGQWFRQRLGWDDYQRFIRETELSEEHPGRSNQWERSFKIMQLANADPEISRKIRLLKWMFALFFVFGVAGIGALPVVLLRPLYGLGALLIAQWPWSLGLLAVCVGSNLLELDEHKWPVARFSYYAVNFLTILGLIGIAVRYVPGLVGLILHSAYYACVWCSSTAWNYKWAAGAVVLAGLACALLPKSRSGLFRFVQRAIAFLGLAFAAVAVLGLGLIYWYVTLAVVALGLFLVVGILARNQRRASRRRMRVLYEANLRPDVTQGRDERARHRALPRGHEPSNGEPRLGSSEPAGPDSNDGPADARRLSPERSDTSGGARGVRR